MMRYLSCIFLCAAIILLSATALSAGTTGKIAGRVVNKDTGEPVAGANVIIVEKQIGAACDNNGRFIIINVPPGKYSVRAQMMGFQTVTKTEVQVHLDLTSTLNFELFQTDTQIKGIVIQSERKLVEKDVTGSEKIVTSETMDRMAVENIQDVVAVTAGAVGSGADMHIRGGRSNEIVYTVDGLSVSNPVDQGFGMSLDMDAVSDMNVSTGGFTAEFGNAQSAIINLITKSGGSDYSGKISLTSDHILSDQNSNYDNVRLSFGGPLIPKGTANQRDKFTFFANVGGTWSDGRYKDFYHVGEGDVLYDLGRTCDLIRNPTPVLREFQVETINNIGGNRDDVLGFDTGDRFNNSYQANIKTKFSLSPKTKFTFSTRGDRSVWIPFSWTGKYALQYTNHWEEEHSQQAITLDHTISPKMFFKIRAGRFNTDLNLNSGVDRDWYFTENNTDWNNPFWNADPSYNNFGVNIPGTSETEILNYFDQYNEDRTVPIFSSPGSHAGSFWDDQTSTYTLKGDLTYQINHIHAAKTGFEIKYNDISKNRLGQPWNIDDTKRLPNYLLGKDIDTTDVNWDHYGCSQDELEDSLAVWGLVTYGQKIYSAQDFQNAIQFAGGTVDGYKARPWQGAFYLQDKMEWEGMIVNAGIRFDAWYLGDFYQVKSDTTGEYIDAEWEKIDYIKQNADGDYELVSEDVEKFQLMISPRLGVSHPITLKDVLHFAYNYQSQLPAMQYVFTSATPKAGSTGTDVGNPNLKPEITKTYEVGIEHQMGEDYVLDVTVFYKNIYNLVSRISCNYANLPDSIAEAGKQYYLYWSDDYGSARGVELTFQKRFSQFWGFNFGYTYSYASGRNSNVHTATENLREFPLSWDVRNNVSLQANFGIPENEEFYLFGLKMPDKFDVSYQFIYYSGTPYTPVAENDHPLDTNSERKPGTSNSNLKLTKKFNLFGKTQFKIFVKLDNLFNETNVNYVDAQTGETQDNGTDTYWENYDLNENGIIDPDIEDTAGAALYLYGLSTPGIYSQGRRIKLGFSVDF